jgi:putative tricarboxylic transport membrane protein
VSDPKGPIKDNKTFSTTRVPMGRQSSWDLAYGGVLFVIGAILFASTFDPRYSGMGIGSDFSPMFFPRVLLAVWMGLSVLIAVRFMLANLPEEVLPAQRWSRLTAVCIAVAVFTWLMEAIGFLLAMVPACIVVALLFGYRRPGPLIGFSVVFPVAIWLIFIKAIQVPLPYSPWFSAF